jgi:signal transduction histidine kinase
MMFAYDKSFIDFTSHELRNPLSVVLQCADSALQSFKHISSLANGSFPPLLEPELEVLHNELKSCHEGLQTIFTCSLQYVFFFLCKEL